MTSHELARALLELPDLQVTIRGYEGGVNFINHLSAPRELVLNAHEEGYYGAHEYMSDYPEDYPEYEKLEKVQAIHIMYATFLPD